MPLSPPLFFPIEYKYWNAEFAVNIWVSFLFLAISILGKSVKIFYAWPPLFWERVPGFLEVSGNIIIESSDSDQARNWCKRTISELNVQVGEIYFGRAKSKKTAINFCRVGESRVGKKFKNLKKTPEGKISEYLYKEGITISLWDRKNWL